MNSIFKVGLVASLWLSPLMAQDSGPKLGLSIREFKNTKKISLAPCPSKPNCVTSIEHPTSESSHLMQPIQGRAKSVSFSKIKYLLHIDGAKIVRETNDYIHATYTSSLLKFVDDVEFYFPTDQIVHFRSASRVGYSDLGVNKRRMTRLKLKFQQTRD